MKKPDIPNFKIVVIGGAAALVLLAALIFLAVKLNTMEDHLLNLHVSAISVPSISLNDSSGAESSEAVSSGEEASEEVSSQPPASSKPAASSKPQASSQPPASSAPAVASEPAASGEEASSGEEESSAEEGASGEGEVASEEEASSAVEVPGRPDGVTRIELLNISGGRSGDLPADKFDELLALVNALNLEETDEAIDSSVLVDARIRIYKGDRSTTYTVYPIWTVGSKVYVEHAGGKALLQYLKTLDVFAGQSFPY